MSEQTKQNDLYAYDVYILDKYECLSLGATTVNNLIDEKRINAKKNQRWQEKSKPEKT